MIEKNLMKGRINNILYLLAVASVFLSVIAFGLTPPPSIGSVGFSSIKPLDFTAWSDGEVELILINDVNVDVSLDEIEIVNEQFNTRCKIKTEFPITLKPNETVNIEAMNCTTREELGRGYLLNVSIRYTNLHADMKHESIGEIYGIYGESLKEFQKRKQEKEGEKQQDLILKISFSAILTLIILIDMLYTRKYFSLISPLLFILIYLVFFSLISSITIVNLSYTGFLPAIIIISTYLLSILLSIVVLLNLSSLTHKQKKMIIQRGGYMVVMYLILSILLWRMPF